MKLNCQKKSLINLGWATIGGRIEDYQNIYNNYGPAKTFQEIKTTYHELTDDVYRGLLVYIKYGEDFYYEIKTL